MTKFDQPELHPRGFPLWVEILLVSALILTPLVMVSAWQYWQDHQEKHSDSVTPATTAGTETKTETKTQTESKDSSASDSTTTPPSVSKPEATDSTEPAATTTTDTK